MGASSSLDAAQTQALTIGLIVGFIVLVVVAIIITICCCCRKAERSIFKRGYLLSLDYLLDFLYVRPKNPSVS